MFRFLCKSISSSTRTVQVCRLCSTSLREAEKSISLPNGNQDSFTAQYLINHFGFSMEKAVFASSKYLNFDKPDKPDSVVSFLKNQGCTESQIRKMVERDPCILSCKPEKTILPKIEFFRSKGCSEKDLARILVYSPKILKRSLENCIVPSFNFIQEFFRSEKDAILAISRRPGIIVQFERLVKPNIEIMLGAGMPQCGIARVMKNWPHVFVIDSSKIKESVKLVQNMGMDPLSSSYGFGLGIIAITLRSTWDKRIEAFKRWGCSEDDVLTSFKISPFIMMVSEEKLNGIMRLFVHEIGWEPSEVVKRYFMFTLGLKKRMIPRWSVYKELLSKGLVKNVNMGTMFQMKEEKFLKMFVNCYKNEAPLLLNLYIEKQK